MTIEVYNNFVLTQLASSISNSATTVPIKAPTSPYNLPPNPGASEFGRLELRDDLNSPSKFEIITYTDRSVNGSNYDLTGVTRGVEGTSAQSWDADHYVIQSVTARNLNPIRGTLLSLSANESIPNSSNTTVDWGAATYDHVSGWAASPNPSRITTPSWANWAILSCNVMWANNSTGDRHITMRKNGSSFAGMVEDRISSPGLARQTGSSALVSVSSGDYFELIVFQSSGGSLDLQANDRTSFGAQFFA